MGYFFFLGRELLPVAPGKLQIRIDNKNKTANLINEGEVNILRTPGLTDVSFEALLPNAKYPFATYLMGFRPPDYYLEQLKKLKTANKPFQFIVCRLKPSNEMMFATNLKVSLEEYAANESAGDGFDAVVSVRLKQYRPYATKVVAITKDENGQIVAADKTARDTAKEPPAAHKMQPGESLWEAVKKEFGDAGNLAAIAAANGIINPNLVAAGQVIQFERGANQDSKRG